jgi:DNA excision repair protein ERCC-4
VLEGNGSVRPTILIDTREQTPLRFSANVDVERVTLSTADYSLLGASDRVAIERKSLPDLVACVGPERERFLDCCRRMRDYNLRCIVVEAAVDDVLAGAYRSRTHPNSVLGTTVALFVDYNVPTIWAGDTRNAANIVERLLTRVWKKMQSEAAA